MLRLIRRVFRKIAGGCVCLYENGWGYTWYHGWEKIGRCLFRYGKGGLPYREVRRKATCAGNVFPPSQFLRAPSSPIEGRTVALFALYAPKGKVPEATFLYIRGLREVADDIIVCADSPICAEDVEQMKSVASCGLFARHGEYDFGSFQRAYKVAEEQGYLSACGKLILANDSCVGPIVPFAGMMSRMSARPCDFWGQTSYSFHGRVHVQSYFMVFSGDVVRSGALGRFLSALPGKARSRADVISSCEIALTESLVASGFSWDSYVPYRAVLKNPTCSPLTLMTRYACPLVKVKALCGETFEPLDQVRQALQEASPAVYEAFGQIVDEWEPVPPNEDLHD